MISRNRPSGVIVDNNQRRVSINWQDNHESAYFFEHLRRICPCAECKDRSAQDDINNPSHSVTPTEVDGLRLNGAEAVGAYALQFKWNDGHSAGIYSWELLRSNCQCDECLSANE